MTSKSNIFTRLTNEVRDDNIVLIQRHHKEVLDADPVRHLAPTKFMSVYEAEKNVNDEVDSILFQHSFGMSSSLDTRSWKTSNSTSSKKGGSVLSGSHRGASRQKKLQDRANAMRHVTDKWHRGPVAIGQPQILEPLVNREGGKIQHPKAKKVQRQTLRLLHNMENVSEMSRRHATIRRRLMESATKSGKDHVLKSLEPYLPETDEIRAEKLMLSLIISNSTRRVKFIPLRHIAQPDTKLHGDESPNLREQKLLLRRLELLWAILNPCDAVKLEFKFIIKNMGDENAYDDRGKLNPLSMLGLEDAYKQINLLETLRRVFDLCTENSVNPYCESESLLTPIVELVHEAGLKRITKGLREDIYSWMLRILRAQCHHIHRALEAWASYRDRSSDGFGVQFFEQLSAEVADFVPDEIPRFAAMAQSRPNSSADSVGDSAAGTDHAAGRRDSNFTVNSMGSMNSEDLNVNPPPISKVKPRRMSTIPKNVPKTYDQSPSSSRRSSAAIEVPQVVVETVHAPITRQQRLLDEINNEKLKYTVDIGDLMKYYTKKPNVKRYYVEEPKEEVEGRRNASEDVMLEPAVLAAVPKRPMISSPLFSFSSGDLFG